MGLKHLCAKRASRRRRKMLNNFVDNYGVETLKWMIGEFQEGTTLQQIAQELGVTRQRVMQWRDAFGRRITHFKVHPRIEEIAKE